jgi:hypothetical protein
VRNQQHQPQIQVCAIEMVRAAVHMMSLISLRQRLRVEVYREPLERGASAPRLKRRGPRSVRRHPLFLAVSAEAGPLEQIEHQRFCRRRRRQRRLPSSPERPCLLDDASAFAHDPQTVLSKLTDCERAARDPRRTGFCVPRSCRGDAE